jgi:GNAT superfamily N-acetyltransferase
MEKTNQSALQRDVTGAFAPASRLSFGRGVSQVGLLKQRFPLRADILGSPIPERRRARLLGRSAGCASEVLLTRNCGGSTSAKLLLADALRRCLELSGSLGIHAVEAHAIDETARGFYEHHGFVALEDDRRQLYLPVTTIRDASRS